MKSGWFKESRRHSLAAKGVETASRKKVGLHKRVIRQKIKPYEYVQPAIKQGKIPDSIWNNEELQKYVNSPAVFGYIGSSQRTQRTDKILIEAWKELGMTDNQIAEGMSWTTARHMADNFDRGLPERKIYAQAIETGKYLLSQPEFGKLYASKPKMIEIKHSGKYPDIQWRFE